jgi:hypothetical protein
MDRFFPDTSPLALHPPGNPLPELWQLLLLFPFLHLQSSILHAQLQSSRGQDLQSQLDFMLVSSASATHSSWIDVLSHSWHILCPQHSPLRCVLFPTFFA